MELVDGSFSNFKPTGGSDCRSETGRTKAPVARCSSDLDPPTRRPNVCEFVVFHLQNQETKIDMLQDPGILCSNDVFLHQHLHTRSGNRSQKTFDLGEVDDDGESPHDL